MTTTTTTTISLVDMWVKQSRTETLRPFHETWADPAKCTLEQLAAYFLSCVDGQLEPPAAYYAELFRRWPLYLSNLRSRLFVRMVLKHLFLQRGNQDVLACAISRHSGELMRKVAPDIYHEVTAQMLNGIDLQLLVDVVHQLSLIHI